MEWKAVVHSLTVSAFSAKNRLLGEKTVGSWLWEIKSGGQNYESFFALRSDQADIGRVEIRNNSTQDFANGLLIDKRRVQLGGRAGVEHAGPAVD